jgi:hypothetical protein
MNDAEQDDKTGGLQQRARSRKCISEKYPARQPTLQDAPNGHDVVSAPISIAVDPVALITTECITITSAMRKHARWAHSSVSAILGGSTSTNPGIYSSQSSTSGDDVGPKKGHKTKPPLAENNEEGILANRWGLRGKKGRSIQDNPLMSGFGRLRRELVGCKGFENYFSTFSTTKPS